MDKNTNTFDYGIDIIHLMPLLTSVGGVMVSIDAFQALDPGSIPGHRNFFTLTKGPWLLTTSSLSLAKKLRRRFFSKITFE